MSQKSDWMEHFETEKRKALVMKNNIEQLDRDIDQIVYRLYELTLEEIDLVEQK